MKITNIIFSLSAAILIAACSSDGDNAASTTTDNTTTVDITLSTSPLAINPEDTVDDATATTRSIAQGSMNSYQPAYVYNDSVGIFPEGGYQIPFRIPMNKGDRPLTSADILAQGWDTKAGTLYAVYHPFVFENRSGSHIPFDLRLIQRQEKDEERDSLGKYWVMASDVVTPTTESDGTVNFHSILHVFEAVVRFRLDVPVTANYVRVMFVAPSAVFATHGYYDLFDTSGQYVDFETTGRTRTNIPIPMTYQPMHAEGYTDHVTLDIGSAQKNAGERLLCYMLVPEANIELQNVTVYLWDSDGNIYASSRALTGTQGYFSRHSMSYLTFNSFTQVPSIDVKINDWEKEELCPTCTPVAW